MTNATGSQRTGNGRLTVVLTDSSTDKPLGGDCAFVIEAKGDHEQYANYFEGCLGEHGRASLAGLPAPDTYTVAIEDRAQQFISVSAAAMRFAVRPGSETVARLPQVRTGSISGTIRDSSGAPLADDCMVQVHVGTDAAQYLGCTDAAGRYRIDRIRPGSYTVYFTSDRYASATWPSKVDVRSEQVTSGIDDTVQPSHPGPSPSPSPAPSATATPTPTSSPASGTGQLTLVLTDKRTGSSLAGDCALTFEVNAHRSGYYVDQQQCVDQDGHVTFTGLPAPDYYSVDVRDAAHNFVGTGLGGRRVFVQPGTDPVVDLPQVRTGSIAGTMTFLATGRPDADDCHLRVFVGTVYGEFDGCTDSRGRYRIDGIKPSTFVVNFNSYPHVQTWYRNAPSQYDGQKIRVRAERTTRVDGILQDGGSLQVTVVNQKTGKPMPRAFIAWHLVEARRYEVIGLGEWRTSCTGKFTAHRIFGASYKLFVRLGSNYASNQWYGGANYGDAAVVHIRNKQMTHITLHVDPTKARYVSKPKPAPPC